MIGFGNNGTTIASTRQGADGFFGNVLSAFEEGLERIGSEVLPIWTAQQLGLQKKDQLYDTTFEGEFAKPRVDSSVQRADRDQATPDLLRQIWEGKIIDLGGFNVTGGGLIIAGLTFVGILFVLKRI